MKQLVAINIKNVPNDIVVKELLNMRISIRKNALIHNIGGSTIIIDSTNKQYLFLSSGSF